MSKEEYQRYLNRHDYQHPVDEETRKISAELLFSQEIVQDEKRLEKDVLRRKRNIAITYEAMDLLEEWDDLDFLDFEHCRVHQNAGTHKKRTKGIKKHHQELKSSIGSQEHPNIG